MIQLFSQTPHSPDLHERADLVARHHLEVVGEPRRVEDQVELGRQLGVGVGGRVEVGLGLLARLRAHEDGEVVPLAVDQREEAEVRELELAAVGDGDLGRALHGDVAVVGREGVDRQALDLAAPLDAAGPGHPAVLGERRR